MFVSAIRLLRCLICVGPLACAQAGLAQTLQPAPTPAGTGVASVVAGILGYTRWPVEGSPLRLCTVGHGPAVDELRGPVDLGAPQRRVAVQALTAPGKAAASCDAVYVARVDAATARELLRALAGQPVLLLGESADFCSDGGMFCLESREGSTRFGANLDAIARSGLRVNPLVLRMARGGRS